MKRNLCITLKKVIKWQRKRAREGIGNKGTKQSENNLKLQITTYLRIINLDVNDIVSLIKKHRVHKKV